MTKKTKRELRTAMFAYRAKRARRMARLLMPLVALAISGAVWTDPILSARAEQKIEDFKPMVEAAIDGRPMEEILAAGRAALALEPEVASEVSDVGVTSLASNLPADQVPVNRPQARPITN